jgi:lysozyme
MKVNNAGIQLIKSFEGCLLNAYLDSVKVPTIGYGATYYQNGTKVKIGDKITQEQANDLLAWHINEFAEKVKPVIKSDLNDNQFSALVSFAFNLGIGNISKSTLLKKANANPSDVSIGAEFLKWNKAGGKVLAGLTRRRKAEYNLYKS